MAQVFQYLKAKCSAHYVFATAAALLAACKAASAWLCSTPERTVSILQRERATAAAS
ncbi:MAG: hypothetical protein OXN97_05330 [Bryobacterales bacterium]|nr:hypothetical protein [Bryobacterales bacterium]MDE0627466.1 hypothetical protein [Bryobacterales bacterium]